METPSKKIAMARGRRAATGLAGGPGVPRNRGEQDCGDPPALAADPRDAVEGVQLGIDCRDALRERRGSDAAGTTELSKQSFCRRRGAESAARIRQVARRQACLGSGRDSEARADGHHGNSIAATRSCKGHVDAGAEGMCGRIRCDSGINVAVGWASLGVRAAQ